jgi:YD repeat-containing protein
METVTDWAGRVTTLRYDRAGRALRMDRANGTSSIRVLGAAAAWCRAQSPVC